MESAHTDNLDLGNKIKQTSPAVDWKFKQYVKKDRSKKKAPRKSPSSPPSIPEIITKSALDPFFRPAVELSVPDQHLLHACRYLKPLHRLWLIQSRLVNYA